MCKHQEGTSQIDLHDLVERTQVRRSDRCQGQVSRVVNDSVESAKCVGGGIEQLLYSRGVGDVALHGYGLATRCLDRRHNIVSAFGIARIIDGHLESVGGKSEGDGAADAAGCASHDGARKGRGDGETAGTHDGSSKENAWMSRHGTHDAD